MRTNALNWLGPARFLLPLLLGLVAAVALACGSGQGGPGDGPQVFRLRLSDDPANLDPQLASFAGEISIVKQLYRGLFTYDEDLNVVPAVASRVPTTENGGITGDGLVYTVQLRDDATWSDGTPVTAQDFVYALQRLFDPTAGAGESGYYYGFYTKIKGAAEASAGEGPVEAVGVTAEDARTLKIELVEPQPSLPILLALWPAAPVRRDAIEQHGLAWTDPGNLIGNGPFVLKERAPGQQIVLERNEAYWGDDEPSLDEVVYRIIPDDSAALLAYENNELDMTSIPVADAERYQGDAQQLRYAQLETYAIQYGHGQAPFDSALVRKAFSRAIDRDEYVRVAQGGVGAPTLGWLPPGLPAYSAELGQDLGFDATGAKNLLDEAGFPAGAGFPKVTFAIADTEGNRLTAEFIKEQIKTNLGVDIEIEYVEESAFQERYQNGDFQMTWSSWFADYADPENWLPEQFSTDGPFNVLAYSNPQFDDLLEQAAGELDNAARLALYQEAHQLLIEEDQAITPIFHPERNYLVKAKVKGLVDTGLDAEPGDWFFTKIEIEGAA